MSTEVSFSEVQSWESGGGGGGEVEPDWLGEEITAKKGLQEM